MKLKVLSCEIFESEINLCARSAVHHLDITIIKLDDCHEKINEGRVIIQQAIDSEQGSGWDAILLGWGLCGRLVNGIQARDIPLVIPRAHDCLTILFGSRRVYTEYFLSHPGTYYLSEGWIKHASAHSGDLTAQMQMGEITVDMETLVEQYGEENAKFIAETLGGWQDHYNSACVITHEESDVPTLMSEAKRMAESRGWNVTCAQGSLNLIKRWLDGDWSAEDFLLVPPGYTISEAFDEGVLTAVIPQ